MLAELALGLAGFTGVAAAFGGRDRTYSTAERARIIAIFLSAGGVLVGTLCVLTLTATGGSATAAYVWASLVAATVQFSFLYLIIPQAYALAKDPEASTSIWTFGLAVTQCVASLCLLAGNLVGWREAWPLIAAFSIQLTWGLFVFARILTQRN